MKKVLITGSSGMLGRVLAKRWQNKYSISTLSGRAEFDFAKDSYTELKTKLDPDIIVHTAALTDLSYCEDHPEEAKLINGESVRKLIDVFPKSKFIFISTDAVFPPNTKMADENTLVAPQTIYGKTKILGEKYVLRADRGISIRTTIVGKNLTKLGHSLSEWIIESLRKGESITLYDDVWFTPIDIWHFADALKWVIDNRVPRILHIGGGQRVTKYQYGLALAEAMDLPANLITRGRLDNLKSGVGRSSEMSLGSKLYTELSGHHLPDMAEVIKMLVKYYQ